MKRKLVFRRIVVLLSVSLVFAIVAACSGGGKGGLVNRPPDDLPRSTFGEVSGSVTDIAENPVEGVTVRVEGQVMTAVTDQLGNFQLANVPQGTRRLIIDGRTATQGKYTTVAQEVYVVGGGSITIDLALRLVRVDTASESSIGSGGGTATNDQIPGLSLDVPAGAVADQATFSITPVPNDNLPFSLPGEFEPVFAFWIEPEGTVLSIPADLTVPNEVGLSPGTKIALFTATVDDAAWSRSGEITVGVDGSIITTTSGGVGRFPYVVGALLPNIVEGRVLTQADDAPALGVTVAATGSFIPSSKSSAVSDQVGRYRLTLVGAAPGSAITLAITHSDYVITEEFRTADIFDLKTLNTPVILAAPGGGDMAPVQSQDILVDRVFLATDQIAVGENRDDIEILTNQTDRDGAPTELRESSQINVNDLLNLDNQVNLIRSDSVSALTAGSALILNDVVATGKRSRALLKLSGGQGFIAADSKSEMSMRVLEEVLIPRKRTIFTTTTNGRFYIDFTPSISGQATDSLLTIDTGNATVEALDASFTFSQIQSGDTTESILEVWRGEVTFKDNIRAIDEIVAEGQTSTITISAGDFPIFTPKNLRAEAGLRQVTLTWDKSIEPNVVGYRVYRRKVGDTDFDKLTTGNDPLPPVTSGSETYTDYSIPVCDDRPDSAIEYAYQVTAENVLGNESQPSVIATAVPSPILLTASSDQAARAVVLTWSDNATDPFVAGYFVYRSNAEDGTYAKLNPDPIAPTPDRTGITFTDDDFTQLETQYYYYVQVKHLDGWEGGRSSIVEASPSAINLTANATPEIRHVRLSWTDELAATDDQLIGYNVYRRLISESSYTKITAALVPKSASEMVFDDYNFPALGKDEAGLPDPKYQYIVRPVRIGDVELTPSDIATVGPLPIDIWVDNLDRAVTVHWTDTALDPSCTGYRVWRSQAVPDQAIFPDDYTRLNQIPVPVTADTNGDGVESYGYTDNTVKNFDYTYVVTPVYDIAGKLEDQTPSPGVVGSPNFELVENFYATGLEFITPDVGFVWGHDGLVIKTIDGGISFESLPVFSADELATLAPEELQCKCGDFINANLGYLLYDRLDGTSYIKRTNSGGDSWETIEINGSVSIADSIDPAQNGVYNVDKLDWFVFISSAAGYAASSDIPCFLVSGNGGIDWGISGVKYTADGVTPGVYPKHPTSIDFFDLKNGTGFAIGEIVRDVNGDIVSIFPPHLWRYKDGVWIIQNETRLADMVEDDAFQFDTLVPMHNQILSGSTAIAFSYTGEQLLGFNSFFASSKLDEGYSEIGFSFDFFPSDVEFDTFQNGYAIGNGFQNGYILKTEMSGNLWTPSLIQPAPFERVNAKLSVVDNDNVFAVSGDRIYRTFDSGDNWEEVAIQIYN